jgi:hypothetical protein
LKELEKYKYRKGRGGCKKQLKMKFRTGCDAESFMTEKFYIFKNWKCRGRWNSRSREQNMKNAREDMKKK